MDYEVKADTLDTAFEETATPVTPVTRPMMAGATATPQARSAFVNGYIRQGRELELKSFTGAVAADGGFAVPREIDGQIDALLKMASPIRAIANVVRVGSAGYRKLITRSGVSSGWASEITARPVTNTPLFEEVVPSFGELYAQPAATQAMLDDAQFDVEGWLAQEIATEFAKAEGLAFVNGDGVNKPKGFLTYPTTLQLDQNRAFGTIQHVPTGVANDFATGAQDKLVDLVHAVRAPYRQGATWVMNANTLARVRKFKDGQGGYIWQPALMAGQPDLLLGYPVVESEDMPDVGANALPIAFGNFKAAYLIAERQETGILRDPFTNKPYVNFYATRRVGGALVNSEAIKFIKISVS